MNSKNGISIVIMAIMVVITSAVSAQTYSYSDLVGRLTDLRAMATPPDEGEKSGSFSSCDRAAHYDEETGKYVNWYANRDGTGFMDDNMKMAEIEGPGVIWRIWSADPKQGNIEIYIDGAGTPTLAMPFLDMFNNYHPPFDYPELVEMLARGQNFYIPISFQKSIRIQGTGDWGKYYQISYTTFGKDVKVPSFTGVFSDADKDALRVANDVWAGRGPQMFVSDDDHVKEISVTLAPGEQKSVAKYSGPGAITSLVMNRPELSYEESLDVLRELTISITWDNDTVPGVWSPIGDFFGTGAGENLFRSLTVGMTDKCYYSNWYMPYAKADIVLRNDGNKARNLVFTIHTGKVEGDASKLLRYHCKWHRDDYSGLDKDRFSWDRWPDWPVLKVDGAMGRFCGMQLHIWNPLHAWNREMRERYQLLYPEGEFFAEGHEGYNFFRDEVLRDTYWWGEGDEKFFVDGEKMPSTFGTGTEDYFGYAWGTPQIYDSAVQCQTRNVENIGHIAVNRWQIADNVPFQQGFEATIEKYHGNNRPLLYAATARWYQSAGSEDYYKVVPVKDRVGYYEPAKQK